VRSGGKRARAIDLPIHCAFPKRAPSLAGTGLVRDIPAPQRIGIAAGPSLTDSDKRVIFEGYLAPLLRVAS